MIPDFNVGVPLLSYTAAFPESPDTLTCAPAAIPSSLAPSTEMSLPSTVSVPFIIIFPFISPPVSASFLASNSAIALSTLVATMAPVAVDTTSAAVWSPVLVPEVLSITVASASVT